MSKSLGNVIAPQKIFDTLGAEILRLWVASTDYSGELSLSDEILKRVVEAYRRIRNTLRFLLANTADFDPASDAVDTKDWLEIDRYALALTSQLQSEVLAAYEAYEFHPVMAKLQTFCSEDLGGFYLDILKDRLYTCAPSSRERRSAQTALWHIAQTLLKLMAPVLSFTAEEAWKVFAKNSASPSRSIFCETVQPLPEVADANALLAKWELLRSIRSEVAKKLEEVRASGSLGSSLQAEVEIQAHGERYRALASLTDDLRFLLITSYAQVTEVSEEKESVVVKTSEQKKCGRCWHYRADVDSDPARPYLCARCVTNLFGTGESRLFA